MHLRHEKRLMRGQHAVQVDVRRGEVPLAGADRRVLLALGEAPSAPHPRFRFELGLRNQTSRAIFKKKSQDTNMVGALV